MSMLSDVLGSLLGGGGGGGSGGADIMREFLDLYKQRIAAAEQEEGRARERAETEVGRRRRDLLSRGGFGGTVRVGPAQQRTSETLAQYMEQRKDTPEYERYRAALSERAQERREATAILTGKQYEFEDAIKDAAESAREYMERITGEEGDFRLYREAADNAWRRELERRYEQIRSAAAEFGPDFQEQAEQRIRDMERQIEERRAGFEDYKAERSAARRRERKRRREYAEGINIGV